MILSGVYLLFQSTDSGLVLPNDHEHIFCIKPPPFEFVDDLDMGKLLAVCADFILTLDDKYAVAAQNSKRLFSTLKIEVQNRIMPLGPAVCAFSV